MACQASLSMSAAKLSNAPESPLESFVDRSEWTAMAGNHDIDRQTGEHFERRPRAGQAVGLAEQFGEDDAETVFPERIARNQDAFFRVVVGQSLHVVTGNGQRLPVEFAHPDFIAGADQVVVLEAGGLLAQRREQQGIFVPLGNGGVETGRDDDFAAESRLQRRVAADVVGVRVRIYEPFEASTAQGVADQIDGLGGVRDIAAIDQRGVFALDKQNVVGRQPAALEDEQRVRKADGHSGLSGSLVGGSWTALTVTASATTSGESNGGRPQPRQ